MIELIAWWCVVWVIPISIVLLFADFEHSYISALEGVKDDRLYVAALTLGISGLIFLFMILRYTCSNTIKLLDWLTPSTPQPTQVGFFMREC